MKILKTTSTWFALVLGLFVLPAYSAVLMKPNKEAALEYKGELLSGNYNTDITRPDSLLGFPVGSRVATPKQIHSAIMTWAEQSDRLHSRAAPASCSIHFYPHTTCSA